MRRTGLSKDVSGSMALYAGGLLLVAVLIIGGVIDYMSLSIQRGEVQAAADNAALAAVREFQIAMNDESRTSAIAETIAKANLHNQTVQSVTANPIGQSQLEVVVTVAPRVFFPGIIGMTAKAVSASAVAQVSGSPVCMIGLDTKVKRTLDMQKDAAITAKACAVYSNSVSTESIAISDSAKVTADFICAAGGIKLAKKMSLTPAPLEDCPPMSDPLADRPPPSVGSCDETKLKIDKGASATLSPGVYCGGLEIKGTAELASGIYIIKNGSLKVKDGGILTGENVGFFLTGDKALIEFEKDSTIRLSAPRTGPLAGLLFYENRDVEPADDDKTVKVDPETGLPKAKEHRIRSDNARELVGTIYLPRNKLLIDGDKPIAAESAYTVIIAREFALASGPEVVLNADYTASNIPVPEGVGNKSALNPRLVH